MNVFGSLCNNRDTVWKLSVIANLTIDHKSDHNLKRNIEFNSHCNFSKSAIRNNLVHLKITPRYFYSFSIENPEKINKLHDVFLAYVKPLSNSYSKIPILLQKESFLS
jgi:hypothetical protein